MNLPLPPFRHCIQTWGAGFHDTQENEVERERERQETLDWEGMICSKEPTRNQTFVTIYRLNQAAERILPIHSEDGQHASPQAELPEQLRFLNCVSVWDPMTRYDQVANLFMFIHDIPSCPHAVSSRSQQCLVSIRLSYWISATCFSHRMLVS